MQFNVATANFKLAGLRGFSLIEVLIAGAIMSSGLAGLAALLIASVAGTAQASHRTSASMLAGSIAASMAISPQARNAFLSPPPAVVHACGEHDGCTAQQFAVASYKNWQMQVSLTLPGGLGVICLDESPFDGFFDNLRCTGSGPLVAKVFWEADEPSQGRLVQVIGP